MITYNSNIGELGTHGEIVYGFTRWTMSVTARTFTSGSLDSAQCQTNLAVLAASALPYRLVNFNTLAALFRGSIAVDFYPATNRWRIVGGPLRGRSYNGDAHAFVAWYRRNAQTPAS